MPRRRIRNVVSHSDHFTRYRDADTYENGIWCIRYRRIQYQRQWRQVAITSSREFWHRSNLDVVSAVLAPSWTTAGCCVRWLPVWDWRDAALSWLRVYNHVHIQDLIRQPSERNKTSYISHIRLVTFVLTTSTQYYQVLLLLSTE
jgi:hypothetical protein